MTDSPNTTAMPDAELLALGEVLDRLVAEYDRSYEFQEKLEGALPKLRPGDDKAEDAIVATISAAYKAAGLREPDEIMNELDAPARRIRRLRAATITGLAVKARLARLDGHDPDLGSVDALIHGVLGLAAGVDRGAVVG